MNYILRAKILPKTKIYGIKPKLIKNQNSSIISLIVMKYHYLREYWPLEWTRLVVHFVTFLGFKGLATLKFDDPERIVDIIPEEYRYRWGIETSYRVEDGFEAKTTSRNFALRVIYFMLSIILYNLWILTRVEVQSMTAYFFKHIVKTEIIVVSGLGPPKW